jgi:Flp pilus assembly CpaF family ATPase
MGGDMHLNITVDGPQGSGKTTMLRFIMEICDRERIIYRIIDSENNELDGPMAVTRGSIPEITVTARQTAARIRA